MTAPEFLQHLVSNGHFQETKWLNRNEFLVEAGCKDTHIYLVEKGSLRAFMIDDGQERNIRFGYEGNIIVALDSFLSDDPTALYIQALRLTRVKCMRAEDFFELIASDPRYLVAWNDILKDLVIQHMQREQDLLTSSPRERYERVLKRSPQVFQHIANRHIANYLRMTPETLSRLKNASST